MKNINSVLVIIFSCCSIYGQQNFNKYFDFFDQENESVYNVNLFSNETILITGVGTCADQSENCSHFYSLDFQGDVLSARTYSDFLIGRRAFVEDDGMWVVGSVIEDQVINTEKVAIKKLDRNGDFLFEENLSIDVINESLNVELSSISPYGCLKQSNKLIIYGRTVELIDNNPVLRGFAIWYDVNDGSSERILYLDSDKNVYSVWDLKVWDDSELIFLYDYSDDQNLKFRGISRYSIDGEFISKIGIDVFESTNLHVPLISIDNGDVITYVRNENYMSNELVRISRENEIIWTKRYDPINSLERRSTGNFIETDDGNIVGVGAIEDLVENNFSGYIFKVDVESGNILWERSYSNWIKQDSENQFYTVSNLVQGISYENNLFLVGIKDTISEGINHKDLWTIAVDQYGCFVDECGGLIQTIDGNRPFPPICQESSEWYFSNPEAENGIYKQSFHPIQNERFVFQRTDTYLDLFQENTYEDDFNEFIFTMSDSNKVISFLSENTEILLYDFNLEIGDLFISDYCDFELYVVETGVIKLTNNAFRNYWKLADPLYPENKLTWIEGIGTEYGFFWPPDFPIGNYGDIRLNCYFKYDLPYLIKTEDCLKFISNLEEKPSFSEFNIFPNPTGSWIQLIGVSEFPLEFEIISSKGIQIETGVLRTIEDKIDIGNISNGIYFLRVIFKNNSISKSFVKH